jgi:hypothetical protein
MAGPAFVPIPLLALALVAVAVISSIVVIAGRVSLRLHFSQDPTEPLATPDERADTRERIERDLVRLRDPKGSPIDVLYAEAKASYDAGRERLKQLEAKAGTLIGIVTTGFGAIAILGDPSKTPKNGIWLSIGLIALAIAFMCALLSVRPSLSDFPSLSHYVLPETVANPSNAPRIKYDLTEAWLRDARTGERLAFTKARFLVVSTAALGVGLGALAANYSIGGDEHKPVPTIRVITVPETSPQP